MNLFESSFDFNGRPQLWDCQRHMVDEGQRAARAGRTRILMQAPTGAGKTIVMCETADLALKRSKRVGVLTDRRRLVDQFVETAAKYGIHCSVIMAERSRWNSPIQVCSRDTLRAILDAGGELPQFDVLLIDECHKSFEDIAWRYPLVFGFSATPIKPNGKSLAPFYQAMVNCPISIKELISMKKLVDVKCYDPEKVGKSRRRGLKRRPVGDPVSHWKKYADGRPTVVFASKRSESLDIVRCFNEAGIPFAHMDAHTSDEERDEIFEQSKSGKILGISNVGVLVEGVDLPWLSCCQILRGCNSLVLYRQAVGRIMRPHESKEHGVFLDHSGVAYEFGLPNEDVEWTLDSADVNEWRQKQKVKDRKPVGCQVCGTIFNPAKACPQCGWRIPRKKRRTLLEQVAGQDGILTRYEGEEHTYQRQEILDKLFSKCVYIARARGAGMNMAAAMFRSQTKLNAWEAGLSFNIPSYDQWKIPAKEWDLTAKEPV